ncbi:hypothetical protein HH1059_14000 [Halorhodospira halochloris]|uniref:Uncharacterized protein n=1 Tax=Halorhodospira halochloris TaxID=1052 RepID=A0A0X8XA24_HALHR|nr:hypothetical protein [Halorhodospira halochloris]MBK1652557.1 hypothetical protein [Halorhodospira halochloris]BAU58144.1 hypothetical protein HH1059_14390 [Halorhodospira halochloris]BBE11073.1 hypothetical protein HH1059_14000 [Halorhodospira halochloris]
MSQSERQQRLRKKRQQQGQVRLELTVDAAIRDSLDNFKEELGLGSRSEVIDALVRSYTGSDQALDCVEERRNIDIRDADIPNHQV